MASFYASPTVEFTGGTQSLGFVYSEENIVQYRNIAIQWEHVIHFDANKFVTLFYQEIEPNA